MSHDCRATCSRHVRELLADGGQNSPMVRASVVRVSCDCRIFVVSTIISETATENC